MIHFYEIVQPLTSPGAVLLPQPEALLTNSVFLALMHISKYMFSAIEVEIIYLFWISYFS